MKEHTLRLGRILGIPVYLDFSWFLIFGLTTWTLAVGYFPSEFTDWPVAEYWLVGAATALMLFISVLIHEFGHSILALRYKVPVQSITLFIFGGVSQIAKEPPSAWAEFWIAIAGPLVSFTLAGLFTLLSSVVTTIAPLFALLKYLAYINGTLAIFNLIPGFPLDGGRVFRAIVWGSTHDMRRATISAAKVGRVIAYGFIFVGIWQVFNGDLVDGLWIAFIGWFLENAATTQVQRQRLEDMLAGYTVSQAMNRNFNSVPAGMSLQQLVDTHILQKGQRSFVVMHGDKVAGLFTMHHLQAIPQSQWSTTFAEQAMLPVSKTKSVSPETDLWAALEEMARDGVNQLIVMSDGKIAGMLARGDIISFLHAMPTPSG